MFKPIYTFLLLLAIFLFFFILSLLPIPSKFYLNQIEIKIPKLNLSFQTKVPTTNKKAKLIIQSFNTPDTITNTDTTVSLITLPVSQSIEYPDSNSSSLNLFFKAIESEPKIHILHYGDSQIEGDRITGYIRQHFQTNWGGSGAGCIIPVKVNGIVQAIDVENKGNWKRYTLYGNKNKKIKHRKYGPLLQFVRYAPIADSLINDSIIYEASLIFKSNSNAYSSNFKFNTIQLYYGNLKRPVLLQYYDGDNFIGMKTLNPTQAEQIISLDFEQQPKEVVLEFVGKDSPDIYGVSFESARGIWVDNVPMRGSSGTDIARASLGHVAAFYKNINVKLIIYQFGVNVVPYFSDNYNFYEQWVYQQLHFLKQANPEMSILVVGVSDMSMNTDSGLVSYPNIEAIRDAQKRAAFKAGCAFWDTYQAMGGRNSMPEWVKSGFAAKDYTHFTPQGAKKIATMLYNAIYNDYIKFKKIKKISL
ncbi:MAG: hypothetical protein HPY79_08590 [Bacteroidales bacterium]|nr:hypothetical protein [Bacteroidales bacterium]